MRVRVWLPLPGENRTLELTAFWRGLDPDEESLEFDMGWLVYWSGDADVVYCRPDGTAEDGSTSIVQMLHEGGAVTTSDFGDLLTLLNKLQSDSTQLKVDAMANRLESLIRSTTEARQTFGDIL